MTSEPSSVAPKKSILLVEDTNTVTALIQIYLMGWKVEFRLARNGREGLALALESPPDLVITDVQMPELDGFGLCAALRSNLKLHDVPVLLVTSLNDEASRQQGRLVGATAFLTKPVSNKELRAQVAALLQLDPEKGTPV
ncbi:MAG: response regulator [Myxococcus sp.]|nr:response regulator [Myxococcus sp.]